MFRTSPLGVFVPLSRYGPVEIRTNTAAIVWPQFVIPITDYPDIRISSDRPGQFGRFGETPFIVISHELWCTRNTAVLRQVSLYGRDAGFEDKSRRRRRRHACNRRSDAITQRAIRPARRTVDIDHDRDTAA